MYEAEQYIHHSKSSELLNHHLSSFIFLIFASFPPLRLNKLRVSMSPWLKIMLHSVHGNSFLFDRLILP